jgi:hypothetical protein
MFRKIFNEPVVQSGNQQLVFLAELCKPLVRYGFVNYLKVYFKLYWIHKVVRMCLMFDWLQKNGNYFAFAGIWFWNLFLDCVTYLSIYIIAYSGRWVFVVASHPQHRWGSHWLHFKWPGSNSQFISAHFLDASRRPCAHASARTCVERLETNDPNIWVSSLNEIQLSGRLLIFINDRELFHLNTAFLKTGIIPTLAVPRPGWLCAPALSLCAEKSASSSPHHTDTSHTDFRTQSSHSVYTIH